MNALRNLLALLLVVGAVSPPAATEAQACAAADRLRRFPLGSVGSQVVLAELTEHRSHLQSKRRGPPLARPNLYWSGKIRLRQMDAKGRLKPPGKSIGKYRAMVTSYYRDIRKPLRRALKQAKKIRGFRAFAKPKLYRCFNRKKCGKFKLWRKGKTLYLSTKKGKRRLDIRWLTKRLKGNFHHPGYTPVYTAKTTAMAYLLQYKWGRRVVLALNVSPDLNKRHFGSVGFKKRYCKSVVSCAAPAGVGDHMSGMDVIAVMPKGWAK